MDLKYRTEDISNDELLDLFVETEADRQIINALKGPSPIILTGSRGVGKSFLLRIAEKELLDNFVMSKTLPVYVTFNKSSLIHSSNPNQFLNWMLARLTARLIRAIRKHGFLATSNNSAISVLSGGNTDTTGKSTIELIADAFEQTWQAPGTEVDISGLPTLESFKDAVEELCEILGIKRVNFFIDEAAHIFRPEQQRQFFTLFRDLRSPTITCNAAVYPGVTSYGEIFQPAHDATFISLDRNIMHAGYVPQMRDIVEKQTEADSTLLNNIMQNGQNFAVLAYAATGNPRILLKTVTRAPRLRSGEINEVIREYYRTEIWSEHSSLNEKYPGHTELIDWGRRFIEGEVLPELQRKNIQYLESEKKSTCYFWIHRDSPQAIKEALRLLAYTGIVIEDSQGIKATRSEIGTRYSVNLGCLFSLESAPASTAFAIAKNLTPRRMTEYGMNHSSYNELTHFVPSYDETDTSSVLNKELEKSIAVLDLTGWQIDKLSEMGLSTIGDVLRATENKLKEAYYVGEKRARRMRSAALTSVYEYLSG